MEQIKHKPYYAPGLRHFNFGFRTSFYNLWIDLPLTRGSGPLVNSQKGGLITELSLDLFRQKVSLHITYQAYVGLRLNSRPVF